MNQVLASVCAAVVVLLLSLPPPATQRLCAVLPSARPGRRGRSRRRPVRAALGAGRRRVAAHRVAIIELCEGLAAELAAGRPPAAALTRAAGVLTEELPHLGPAVESAGRGTDVAAELERAARAPGSESLRLLAGCWRIGVDRGAALATVVDGLAGTLREEEAHREEIALHLAGPRATARLLAVLPVLGLLMAAALGARPLAFLFGTVPGAACLTAGLALDLAGLWWTRRLATAAE